MDTLASVESTQLTRALAAWEKRLGIDHVTADRADVSAYAENVSAMTRHVPAVIRPGSAEEVQHAVRIANEFGIPLHPISCGKNWGLGSRLPTTSDTVICDLSRMNRIREVNAKHRYAIIEPGVTQGQLYAYIQENDLPVVMNVTGAGTQTSVIGNALERGIGYFATRGDELCSMEIVLGNGDMTRTGFAHYPVAHAQHLYGPGIGPALDSLMMQSNFGIVTRATVALLPRPQATAAMIATISDDQQLPAFMDALRDLRRDGLIRTIAHVGNSHRSRDTLGPLVCSHLMQQGAPHATSLAQQIIDQECTSAWTAICGLHGSDGMLKQAKREIRRRLAGLSQVRYLDDERLRLAKSIAQRLSFLPRCKRRLAMMHAIEPLYGLTKGIPTDAALHSMVWPLKQELLGRDMDLDGSSAGMLYCLPLMPATGKDAAHAVDMTETTLAAHGFTPYITLNLLDDKTLEAVVNVVFDRSVPAQVDAARIAMRELQHNMIKRGYLPYRVNIDAMEDMVDANDMFWKTVKKVKGALDPNGVISPGRYCP